MEAIDSNGLDQFRTQRMIMAGTWQAWDEESKREHIRILIREAHKSKYDDERLIMVYDE